MKRKVYCFISLTICFLVFYSMRWFLLSQKQATKYRDSAKLELDRQLLELRGTNGLLKAAVQHKSSKGFEFLWEWQPQEEKPIKVSWSGNPMAVFDEIKREASKVSASRLEDFARDCNLRGKPNIVGSLENRLSRAKSSQCRTELLVTACMQRKRSLYPKVEMLPNYCDNHSSDAYWKNKSSYEIVDSKKSLKIVFLLQLSGRSDRQVERLLKSIYSPENAYLIHIDTGSHYLYSYVTQLSAQFNNIRVMKSRFETLWGSSHLLLMQFAAFQEASLLWPDFDYILNLSESDLPIRPLSQLMLFLQSNWGHSFVSATQKVETYAKKQGLHYTFYQCDGHLFRLEQRKIPSGVEYTGGSDWFVLHRDFVDYVMHPPLGDELAEHLISYFAFTILPSESFFATLISASKLCELHKNTDLRYVSWGKNKVGCFCKEKSTVDWCGCSPLVIRNLTNKWFYHNNIVNNTVTKESRFFARKFDPVVSLSAINNLAQKLPQVFGQASTDDQSWRSFWLNFFHANFDTTNPALLVAMDWLKNISLSKIQSRFSQDFGDYMKKALRADHYFFDDLYSGDVITFRHPNNALLRDVALFQVYIQPREKIDDYFDGRFFSTSLQITANFDAKENCSRNFNNRLTTRDSTWTVFNRFSQSFLNKKLNQSSFHVIIKRGMKTQVSKIVHPRLGDTFLIADYLLHPENLESGVWNAQVKDSNDAIIATQGFFVLGGRMTSISLKEASRFWTLTDYCRGGNWSRNSIFSRFDSCESKPWSIYYPDEKSLLTQTRLILL